MKYDILNILNMTLPDNNIGYSNKSYWDERFSKEEDFDWCKDYSYFENLIKLHIHKSDRILMIGLFTRYF